jgi:hypothetical protein
MEILVEWYSGDGGPMWLVGGQAFKVKMLDKIDSVLF